MYYHTIIHYTLSFFILLLVVKAKKVKVVEDKSLGLRCISQKLLSLIWVININIVSQKWLILTLCMCFNLLKKKRTRHNCCEGGRRVTGKAVTIFLWSSDTRHKVHQQDRVGMTPVWQNKKLSKSPKLWAKWSKLSLFSETKTFYSNTETFFPKRQFPILILSLFQRSKIKMLDTDTQTFSLWSNLLIQFPYNN